jgi:uncharacterized RDD family membrane protein YckC
VSELVTGEAVVLALRPARLPSRTLAILIDLVVAFTVYLLVSLALVAATASLDAAAHAAVGVATFLLVLIGGPIAVETLSRGRSLGKLACGLRVVRDDGGPIRFRHALVRGAMGVIEILTTAGVVAVIASLVSARGRRLGDVFAGTLVVRERIPVPQAVLLAPPPPRLAGQLERLDLSRMPEGLWLAVRQYLTRMEQLDPQAGQALAQRLANDVAGCTGTPVPDGVPPAVYIAAVAGERQARDRRRAFGGDAAGGKLPGGSPVPVLPAIGLPRTSTVPGVPITPTAAPDRPGGPADSGTPGAGQAAQATGPAPAGPGTAGARGPAAGDSAASQPVTPHSPMPASEERTGFVPPA